MSAGGRSFLFTVILLGLLTLTGPMAMNLFLPSIPLIAADLNLPIGSIELTVTSFLAGNAVGQIVYGPLADRFGRRPVILVTVALYFLSAGAAGLSSTIEPVIFWRFLQGLVSAAGRIVAHAAGRDLYERERLGRLISYMFVIGSLASFIVSPGGGFLSEAFGWQAPLLAMSVYGVLVLFLFLFFFRETLPEKNFDALRPLPLVNNGLMIMRNRVFVTNVICGGFMLCGLVAYLNSSSGVLQGYFGLEPSSYGFFLASTSIGSLAGSYFAGTLVVRVGMVRLIAYGLFVCVLGGFSMAALALAKVHSPLIVVVPMFFFMAGFMMIIPQTTAGALTPFQTVAGTASSIAGFIQNMMGAGTSALLAFFSGGSALPMALAVAAASVGSALMYVIYIRPRPAAPGGRG